MKKTLCLYIALFAMCTTFAAKLSSNIDKKTANATQTNSISVIINSSVDETSKASAAATFRQLTLSDLQKTLGRKLTIKEKVSWWLFKKNFIHIDPTEKEIKNANTNAVLGFVLGILSLVGLSILAGIPGLLLSNKALSAEKADSGILNSTNKTLAKIGQITSWVGIALFVAVLIYLLALLSQLH